MHALSTVMVSSLMADHAAAFLSYGEAAWQIE